LPLGHDRRTQKIPRHPTTGPVPWPAHLTVRSLLAQRIFRQLSPHVIIVRQLGKGKQRFLARSIRCYPDQQAQETRGLAGRRGLTLESL
jgi:hypothetical protein